MGRVDDNGLRLFAMVFVCYTALQFVMTFAHFDLEQQVPSRVSAATWWRGQ